MATTVETRPPPDMAIGPRLRRPSWAPGLVLGATVLVMRLAVVGDLPTEWDSTNLSLGLDRFDVRQDSPHAPGYWLYVVAGRLVRAVTFLGDNHSLVLVAAVASAALVVATYLVGREIGGTWFGIAASVLVATSPFVWFYGSVAASYGFDALVGMLLVLLALRARPGSRHGVLAAGLLGLGAGFRPTVVVMFALVTAVVGARSLRTWRQVGGATLAGLTGLCAWIVPMVLEQPGGWGAWRSATDEIFTNAAKQTALLTGSPEGWTNLGRAVSATTVAAAPAFLVGAAALGLCLVSRRRAVGLPRTGWALLVLAVTAVPGLVFVALTHFPKPGYAVAFVPPLIVLALLPAAHLGRAGRVVVVVLVVTAGAVNAQRFLGAPAVVPLSWVDRPGLWVAQGRLGAPFPLTRAEIRRVDRLSGTYSRVRELVDPASEVLVFDLHHAPGNYRFATYALPEYRMHLSGGGHVFRNAWRRQQRFVTAPRLVVPPGGAAVLAMDHPTPDVDELVRAGVGEAVGPPGQIPVLVRFKPGTTLFGLPIVEGAPEPYTP